ncbi:MAG: protein kinase, partial [Gemmataceae bacterium]|nr:protein kinase [Gemmata sp.]MDW8196204.1 protein kinase [Gemmataceae bacterium]
MPAPTTADELIDLIHKSHLLDEERFRAYIQKLRETQTLPSDPQKLAALMVRDALLTYFQAEQLLQGKYKRFSLGKYKVLERLGSGGMGTVFLCEHKLMRRRVAVKVLPLQKVQDEASLKRFYREARAVAAVDHPNIVRAYDIDQDEHLHFIVMEWVDGTNLHDLVKKFGPLDPLRACHYIYGAAVGLQHAYEIGLLHRDIKPGNILIDRSGVVKILDLGLARLTHDTEDNLTRQNDENVLGTADYLAPEQALDSHTVDIRADIYSLGATFYYLLTGSPPFPEGSVAQKLIWHQNRMPRSIKSIRPEVPDEIVAIVERMMAKDPAQRFQTPAEVMAALAPWVATPIPPPAEREMPTLSPLVASTLTGPRPAAQPLATAAPTGAAPRTLAATSSSTSTALPTVAPAPTAAMVTTPPPSATVETPTVWAHLDIDTPNVARGDTQTPRPGEDARLSRPLRSPRRAAGVEGSSRTWLVVGIAAMAIVGVGIAIYFAFFTKSAPPPPPPPPAAPVANRTITVSKTAGENTVATLREALLKATPGDTIVITEPRLTEVALTLLKNKHKDLTIESALPDGKPTVIEYVGLKGGTMLNLSDVEGVRLKNVELDGKGQAEIGVQLGGLTPGVTIENVILRNLLLRGVYLINTAGEPSRPVTFSGLRVLLNPEMEAGIVLFASSQTASRHILIKNSRWEGPGKAAIRIDGAITDCDIRNNRFYNLNAVLAFTPLNGRTCRGQFINNTVYQVQNAWHFENPGKSRVEWTANLNYFARTTAILATPEPLPGFTTTHNFHDATTQVGHPSFTATLLNEPVLPPPNPNDDAPGVRLRRAGAGGGRAGGGGGGGRAAGGGGGG